MKRDPTCDRRTLFLAAAAAVVVGKPVLDRVWLGPRVERAFDFPSRWRTDLLPTDPLFRELFVAARTRAVAGYPVSGVGDPLLEASFRVPARDDGKVHVEVVVTSSGTDVVSQNPLLLSIAGRRFFLPFIQSLQETRAAAYLLLEPGEYEFRLEQLAATAPLRRDAVRVTVLVVDGTPLQRLLWARSPLYALYRNNMADVPGFWKTYRPIGFERVTTTIDDMPTLTFCRLYRLGGNLMTEDMLVRMSQNDGKPASVRLALGRTQDAEWSVREVLTSDGDVEDEIVQGERHIPIRLRDQRFGTRLGQRRVLQIATANGNFSYDVETDVFLAKRRQLLPGWIGTDDVIALNPALRHLGYLEEARTRSRMGIPDGAALAREVLAEMRRRHLPPYPQFPAVDPATG